MSGDGHFKFLLKSMQVIALACTVMIFTPLITFSQVIFVDHSADGSNDGTSWEDAYLDLQDALQVAVFGDEIWVAGGTYYPTSNEGDRSARFVLPDGVALLGGFGGFEVNSSERNIGLFRTTLSGDINRTASLYGNSHTILDISHTSNESLVDGFTIFGGNAEIIAADGYPRNNSGGGIYNNGRSATIANCVISGNSANQGAGMTNVNAANVYMVNTVFRDNKVIVPGGGGGLLNADGSRLEIVNCTFDGNSSQTTGGAILNLNNSVLYIQQSDFLNNQAINGAAIYCFLNSRIEISRSVFQGNRAIAFGGVIASVLHNQIHIDNSVITGNIAKNGGTFYGEKSHFDLYNITAIGNAAHAKGGLLFDQLNSTFNFYNSILWENKLGDTESSPLEFFYSAGDNSTLGFYHSIVHGSGGSDDWNVEGAIDGGGNRDFDPKLVASLNAIHAPSTYGDYRLTECSPAVNFGRNYYTDGISSVDIEGNYRIIDGIVDMGAYEFDDEIPPPEISCKEIVIELEANGNMSLPVNDLYVVIDSCGPVEGQIFGMDSLVLDCSSIGINYFTVYALDLFSEKVDSCELKLEVLEPTYRFTINEIEVHPGDELTFCPGIPLKLALHKSFSKSAPIISDFRLGMETVHKDILLDYEDDYFEFLKEEEGVYPLTFLSIEDENGCVLGEDRASQYFFFINIEFSADTTLLTNKLCRGDFFRGRMISSDTVFYSTYSNLRGCDSIVIDNIEVFDSPELTLEADSVICSGSYAQITAPEGFISYEWDKNSEDVRQIQVYTGGFYSITARDEFGCQFEEEIYIMEPTPIDAEIRVQPTTCPSSEDGVIQLKWISLDEGDFAFSINDEMIPPPYIFSGSTGLFFLGIEDQFGCRHEEWIDIDYQVDPFVEIMGPAEIEFGDSLILWANTNLPQPDFAEWLLNGQPAGNGLTLGVLPDDDLVVEIEVIGPSACRATALLNVEVYEPAQVFIPNAFSPNRDGINDFFTAFADEDYLIEKLLIKDRWGNTLYRVEGIPANMPELGWNGEINGQVVNPGDYLYLIELRDSRELHQFSGTVTLLR